MLLHFSLPTASNHANPASRAQCVSQPNRLPSPRLSAKQTRHSAKLSLIHIFCNKTPLQATSCNRAPKPRASKKVIYYGAYKTICSLFFFVPFFVPLLSHSTHIHLSFLFEWLLKNRMPRFTFADTDSP